MDCSEVRELLSPYYDDELSFEEQVAMAEHFEGCEECSAALAGFEKLSAMARHLDTPAPPAQIWPRIERQLEQGQGHNDEFPVEPADHKPRRLLRMPRLVALAAMISVAVVAWIGYSAWFEHGLHDEFTVEFGHYLDEFRRDPTAAQQFLLAKYEGQVVDAQQAVQLVGYRPAIAAGLPEGYAVESTCVMKMPCCTCVQSLCKRSDGSTIAIFEHDDEETKQWFGDRPEVSAISNGKQCSLVELDERVAASWKRDNRHITAIGLRDLDEVSQLVAWLDEGKQSRLR